MIHHVGAFLELSAADPHRLHLGHRAGNGWIDGHNRHHADVGRLLCPPDARDGRRNGPTSSTARAVLGKRCSAYSPTLL